MKLIYIVNVSLPGEWAHSIQVMKMCEAFAANGLEIELVSGRKKGREDDIFSYYNIKTKFKITKIFCFRALSISASKINFLIRSFSFFLFARLYVMFKKYDILYFRDPLAGLFFNDYYLEVHNLPPRLSRWHEIAFKKAKKIIVLTKFLKERLINYNIEGAKIIIAPDAVNLAEFQINLSKEEARKKLSLPLEKKIIMYCGNFYFYDWKGVDILLESLKYLNDMCCVLVGGEEPDFVKIKDNYQSDNLILIGHRSHQEIPVYLKAADVLILPNKKGNANSEYYTSPLKLFEYMASGRPIVASDLPSIREILNEDNSVLVEPNNPVSLAEGIKKIIENNVLAKKIAEQALLDVRNYSWDKRAANIINFIK